MRFVKAATLKRLVEALSTDDGELDTTFVNVFLATYRTFARPDQVLDLLLDRYERLYVEATSSATTAATQSSTTHPAPSHGDPLAEQHRHKDSLIKALHVWLDGYPEDWTQPNLKRIVAFTSHRLSSSEIHYKALHRLDQVVRERAAAQQLSCWHHSHPSSPGVDEAMGGGGSGLLGGSDDDYADYANYTTLLYGSIMNGSSAAAVAKQNGRRQNGHDTDIAGLTPMMAAAPYAHFMDTYRFPNVSASHFASQMTRMDVALFKRLIPHQCLGATWARRGTDKKDVHTVLATIEQFNAVLFAVSSSILLELNSRPGERAAKLAMWIDIAKELRVLKNFSSLKAIVSGLQSNPIYRLSQTWKALDRERVSGEMR